MLLAVTSNSGVVANKEAQVEEEMVMVCKEKGGRGVERMKRCCVGSRVVMERAEREGTNGCELMREKKTGERV